MQKRSPEVSLDLRLQFIESHLPLVKRVVGRIQVSLPPWVDGDDLYSIGLTGLVSAVHKYDASKNETFEAFAAIYIRSAVMDELRRMDWMSRGWRQKAKKLKQCIARIEQREGRAATEEEIRADLSLTLKQYPELLEAVKPVTFVQLDAPIYREEYDDIRLHELIPDPAQVSPRREMEKRELIELMVECIEKLSPIPKKVLAMYYFEEMRLAEIAVSFGVTESRICQIHTRAILILRKYLDQVLNYSLTSAELCK